MERRSGTAGRAHVSTGDGDETKVSRRSSVLLTQDLRSSGLSQEAACSLMEMGRPNHPMYFAAHIPF